MIIREMINGPWKRSIRLAAVLSASSETSSRPSHQRAKKRHHFAIPNFAIPNFATPNFAILRQNSAMQCQSPSERQHESLLETVKNTHLFVCRPHAETSVCL